ncbi:hypothetical protein [Flavihumibacter sp. CACIAM 22H1]|uniref:hypothetical protein n=1 Tax=Flavihumibacter sp. CACIAM 22H1 TaxID=1812911 RepID=UPI0007A92448|nr:hypothetical protein [Flavihumibacter sp. CACIAM 22H1]KYP16554.1 MAG: hypothetical protein A1D16_09000 [Flavihumibacter sp. CACIAM 22H1]
MLKGPAFTLLACLVFGLLTVQAQTVVDVLEGYEKALGGKEKLQTLQSVYLEGVSIAGNGNEIISKLTKVDQKLMRSEISFGMGSISVLLTDQGGWISNPRNGGKFEPMPEERYKAAQTELDITGPLYNYAAKGHQAVLEGKETINGKDAFKIKLTLKNGNEITYYLDAATYLPMREIRKGAGLMGGGQRRQGANQGAQPQELITDFADYKATPEGFIFPFTVKRNGMGGETIYEKIEVNKTVDPKLYKPE